ncbi:MAG TPA: IS630 family transposase [Streptosporangiaceae bacterium]|nr:IS630 family transposase [Streptosporangiaceae bacterium]HVB43668.1 IS630 family transposase [Streptosporangiaceae bacterium]
MARASSPDIVIPGYRRKAKLEAIVRRGSAPRALVRRARIVLLAFRGWPNEQIARELGCAVSTVRAWRRRFTRCGLPGLRDRPRSGRPEVYGPDVRLRIAVTATSVPPEGCSAWTHRLIAAELAGTGIPALQAGRILAGLDLAPHKVRGWLNRRDDDQFRARAAAVCDLYLRPPANTVLICIDEKTGIQAKCRKYPERAARPGRAALRELEYIRNGTVSVIAALDVATGQVIAEPVTRNDPVAFTGFLHRLDQCIAPHLNIHLIMDNGSSHVSRATRARIAARPRITVTRTPVHASWLDMAELWFSVLTRGLLRRGEFTSRADLTEKISNFTIRYNRTAQPFTRAYDARTDHARYQARHAAEHPSATTGTQPLTLAA